jgi:hypothetical protein
MTLWSHVAARTHPGRVPLDPHNDCVDVTSSVAPHSHLFRDVWKMDPWKHPFRGTSRLKGGSIVERLLLLLYSREKHSMRIGF